MSDIYITKSTSENFFDVVSDSSKNARHDKFYKYIKISIASPKKILSFSHGEVVSPETINYRTSKPEFGGLFCARIFGPVKDYECLCQRYRKIKYKGVVCEKCGVEVIHSRSRRERMGHINLAYPVIHSWYLYSNPSKLSIVLNLPIKTIESIMVFEQYIVIEPGDDILYSRGDVITQAEYDDLAMQYDVSSFNIQTGAKGIMHYLETFDVAGEVESLEKELPTLKSVSKRTTLLKRLTMLKKFLHSENKLEWLIISVLPVIPPDLRPLIQVDHSKFFSSDLNELYRRIINRNNRLKSILDMDAPSIILRNELMMLQDSVDALFENGKRTKVMQNNRRLLKSLTDYLTGKQGIFRQNLLGKRVDYSGRSVITVGPSLQLHQCGLPYEMAVELFKPFLCNKLETYGKVDSVKSARDYLKANPYEAREILQEILNDKLILLNRAPTLHKLSIQAFHPVLVNSKSIHLHPLACKAFNADFDGDQMAVHIPISIESQIEARVLMMSINNVISPSTGSSIINPTQDMILGLFYATNMVDEDNIKNHNYNGISDVEWAFEAGAISYNTAISCIIPSADEDGIISFKEFETTLGRIRLFECLPQGQNKLSFDVFNKTFIKADISKLYDTVYAKFDQNTFVRFADSVMKVGFFSSTISGLSFSMSDIKVPDSKSEIVAGAVKNVLDVENKFTEGFITKKEKYNKVTDIWQNSINTLSKDMMSSMSANSNTKDVNAIYALAYSGARGSTSQMKQLAAMRGLMSKSSGEIIETPVISNFKEGLTILEYFISASGARKGLADTALKTADAGYLTRRLVDVAHSCIISSHDCGTTDGIIMENEYRDGMLTKKLSDIVYGRFTSEDSQIGDTLVPAGTYITEEIALLVDKSGIKSLKVRSPATCSLEKGICAKCYGKDSCNKNVVDIGEAVGVIAAQSIGEPGTQLTMDTFHMGGIAMKSVSQNSHIAPIDGHIVFENLVTVTNSDGDILVCRNGGVISVISDKDEKVSFDVPYGSVLMVTENQNVSFGETLCEFNPYTTPIISEFSGTIVLQDLKRDVSFKEMYDNSGKSLKTILKSSSHPRITIKDSKGEYLKGVMGSPVVYYLTPGTILNVEEGSSVNIGDIIARMPSQDQGIKDITGGLPRIVSLLEARKPAHPSTIAINDGVVKDIKTYHSKKCIVVEKEDGAFDEYLVDGNSIISVSQGSPVKVADILVDGIPNPHDILKAKGVPELVKYMATEMRSVYGLQGVDINHKHFEVILRYMLCKISISNPGDTHFVEMQVVSTASFHDMNQAAIAEGKTPAEGSIILQGITNAALQTDSFISAASFQESNRVLPEAAFEGKIDSLMGLKENVIVGKLIPAGTGFYN